MNTQTNPVLSIVETLVNGNMLRYQVGLQMWCPGCQQCLDWQDAVAIDFINPDKSVIYTKCYCGQCFDKNVSFNLDAARTELEAQVKKPISVTITDGREYLDDSGRLLSYRVSETSEPCQTRWGADRRPVEVAGFVVEFLDTPWAQGFVYKTPEGPWAVIAGLSGGALAFSGSQKGAILAAARGLLKCGGAKFHRSVDKAIRANKKADKKRALAQKSLSPVQA